MQPPPDISVIVLNYNGAPWLRRCIDSLTGQTITDRLQIIVADNHSTDGSNALARELLAGVPCALFLSHGTNLGFCAGNNRAARAATGRHLFFLNNDTWLEPDCLEKLLREVDQRGADAATPLMLNYTEDSVQSAGGAGFDFAGWMSFGRRPAQTQNVFVVGGCSYLIRREVFERLGGFDEHFFMYAEEFDLSWRLWAAGYRALIVPHARLHHRDSGATTNQATAPARTSVQKRFLTNRNNLLVILKNAQHVLLLLAVVQVAVLCVEMLVWLLVYRDPRTTRAVYLDALADCWRSRRYVLEERRRIARLRRRSDWWMLRFFRLRPNRWDELRRLVRFGKPAIS